MFQCLIIGTILDNEVTDQEDYVFCCSLTFVFHRHDSSRPWKKRIYQKLWHEETTTVLQLSLYMGVLAILKDYVMVFQVCASCAWKYYIFTATVCTFNVELVHFLRICFHAQGSQTLVHKLHDRQLELFLSYLACFVKAEHITKVISLP